MMSAHVVLTMTLLGAVVPTDMQTRPRPAAAMTIPDTAAGRGLTEFIDSFNAGGDERKAWAEQRTTLRKENADGMLQQDVAVLGEHGKMSLVRVLNAAATSIDAVVRHEKTGFQGHLTVQVDGAAPNKIINVLLRPAPDYEARGLGLPTLLTSIAAGLVSGPLAVWFASARNSRHNRRDRIC